MYVYFDMKKVPRTSLFKLQLVFYWDFQIRYMHPYNARNCKRDIFFNKEIVSHLKAPIMDQLQRAWHQFGVFILFQSTPTFIVIH